MSLNRSLAWHYHSDSEEPPSEKKSFRRCDGYCGRRREGGGGGVGKSKGFNAKARDVCKTDVGLCSGNGPWVPLLAQTSVRRNKKWQMKEITERSRQWRRLEVVPIQQSCLVMWVLTTDSRHSLNPTMSKLTQLLLYCCVSTHYFLDALLMRHPTDAYYLAAILFYLLSLLSSPSIGRKIIVTSESKV